MKRLTAIEENGNAFYPYCFREDTCFGAGESEKCLECDFAKKVCETKVKLVSKLIINRMEIAAIIVTSPIWIIPYLCFRLSAIRKNIKEENHEEEKK